MFSPTHFADGSTLVRLVSWASLIASLTNTILSEKFIYVTVIGGTIMLCLMVSWKSRLSPLPIIAVFVT